MTREHRVIGFEGGGGPGECSYAVQMAPLKHEDRFLAEHNVDAALARSRYGARLNAAPKPGGSPRAHASKPTITTDAHDRHDDPDETGDLAGCFGVFDGHVNASASSYVERHILRALLDQGADSRGAVLEMCCTEAFRYLETSYKKLGAARPQSSEEGMFPSLSAPANPRRASSCMPWCGLPKRGGVDGENGAAIEGGTTACVAVLQMLPWGSDPRVDVVVANAGDSGALLVFEGAEEGADQNDDADEAMVPLPEADGTTRSKPPPMTKWLTRCHSPEDPLEAKRLTDAGARLGRMRRDGVEVGPMRSYPGGYAVSRAIGDFDAPHVVCTPEVKRVRAPERGCVLVVASDGVWNVVSEDDCARIIRDVSPDDVKSAAEKIMEAALGTNRGLHDDATVVVVRVPPPRELLAKKLRTAKRLSIDETVNAINSERGSGSNSNNGTPAPRKSWTRQLSPGSNKSPVDKVKAEMEDDVTVRRGRVSLDETSADGGTHRVYARMDGGHALGATGRGGSSGRSDRIDRGTELGTSIGSGDGSSGIGTSDPGQPVRAMTASDFRNQKMRSLEDPTARSDGGLIHALFSCLCGVSGNHSATIGFDDVAGDGRNLHDAYDVGKLLGRGSYGSVRECTLRVIPSKATAEHLKPRAVKSIASNGSRHSASLIRDEVDTMLAVSGRHPNLPTVYDVYEKCHRGVAPGTTVHVVNIVTEQYAGGDLLEGIARRKRFTVSDFEAIALQLLGATSFLHNVGVVHRDIKPDNIMLRRHWYEDTPPQIVLLDFGGAAFARGANKAKLRGSVGTKFYSAPEVVSGKEYGAKADVWSVAVTLMVLLTGVPAPHRIAKDWKAILCGEVLRLPRGTPSRFGRLVKHMLVPKPETRPSATAALSSAAWLLGDGRMMSWRAAKEAQIAEKRGGGGGSAVQGESAPKTKSRLGPGSSSRSSSDGSPLGAKFPGDSVEPAWRAPAVKESTVHWTFPKSAQDPTPAMPPRRPSVDQELRGAARRVRTDSRRSKFERAATFVLSVALGRDKTAALVSALREAGYDEGSVHRAGRTPRAGAGGFGGKIESASGDDGEAGASDLVPAEALEAALWKIDAVDAAMQVEILRREATDASEADDRGRPRESDADGTDEEPGGDEDGFNPPFGFEHGSGVSVEFSRVLTLAELHDNHARINETVRNEYIESRGSDGEGTRGSAHFPLHGGNRRPDDDSLREGMLMATLTRVGSDEGSLSAAIDGKEGSIYGTIPEEGEEGSLFNTMESEGDDGNRLLNVGVQSLRRASQSGENLAAVEEAAMAIVRSGSSTGVHEDPSQ